MTSFRVAFWALLALVLLAGPAPAAPYFLKVRFSSVVVAPTIPLLGPGATWTGTLNTVAAPSDPARGSWPSAKPSLHWMDPSDMPLVTDQVRCVESHAANGGVASVEIGSESTTGVQAALVVYNRPLTRGGTSSVYAWCVQLNSAAFRAAGVGGAANLWARATAVDGTMQQRVIGGPVTQSGYDTEQYAGNYPMTLYPRTAENDTSVTVCASSCTYTTIKAALDALRVTPFERPLITLMDSGFYVLANAGGTERASPMRVVITNGAGVVAVLGQSSITYNNTTTWNVTPGWDGIEFRGNPASGGSLTIDMQWLNSILTGSKGLWYNGINVTNSAGFPNIYWNGNVAPGGGSNHMSYADDMTLTNISGFVGFGRYAQNVSINTTYNSVFTGTSYVYNTTVDTYTNDYFIASALRGVTVRYTPPGGQTTATIEKNASAANTSGADIVAKANGSTVCTVHAGYYSTDTLATVTPFVAAFNAACPGFVMTLNTANRGPFRASSIGGLNAFSATTVFNVDGDFPVGYEPHAEWWQGTTGGGIIRQNVVLQNNTVRNATNVPIIRNDADFGYDFFWIGNNWTGTNNQGPQVSGSNQSHYQILYNTMNSGWTRNEYIAGNPASGANTGDQTYSLASNNIIDTVFPFGYSGSGSNFPNSFPFKNTVYTTTAAWVLNGPNDTGIVPYTGSSFASLFTNSAIGDFRPVAAGTLLSNLFTPKATYDGRMLPFAGSDIAGNWSKNDPYP